MVSLTKEAVVGNVECHHIQRLHMLVKSLHTYAKEEIDQEY